MKPSLPFPYHYTTLRGAFGATKQSPSRHGEAKGVGDCYVEPSALLAMTEALAGLGWFLSMYFDKNSTLSGNNFAVLLSTLGLGVLGIFIGLRIRQYTKIIEHDLTRIGTSIHGSGWQEYAFVFIVTAVILVFGILSFFGIR